MSWSRRTPGRKPCANAAAPTSSTWTWSPTSRLCALGPLMPSSKKCKLRSIQLREARRGPGRPLARERAEGLLLDMRGRQLRLRLARLPLRTPPPTQGPAQWQLLHQIFYCKSEVLLEYEAKKLIEDTSARSGWEQEEDEMLRKIVGYPPGYSGAAATITTSGTSSPGDSTKTPASSICVRASSVANVGSTT